MKRQLAHSVLWALCLVLAEGSAAQFDRDWKIFVVPFSHTDVGFTAPVPEVVEAHGRYLDDVVAYIDQTQSEPPESRFKWTVEITWVLEHYLESRSPEQIEALMNHVREGRIEIAAMHFSLQTDLAGPEELVRSLYFAQELKEAYGIPVQTAVTNDTPGFTWSLAQLLPRSDIPFVSLAMNSFLSDFFATTQLPNLFFWEAQSGDRTLVWRSMHPRWAYLEGSIWGLYSAYSAMEQRLTAHLQNLAASRYPYDVVLINAATGDNGPPRLTITDNARTWNERHAASTMYVATFADFFEYVTENVAEDIPVFRGDAPNWWSWSFAASATGGFLASRKAQALLPAAETAASIADALVPGYVYPAARLRRAYIDNLLYEDHNLGAVRPSGNAPFWRRKMDWIGAANDAGEAVLAGALDAWGSAVQTGPDAAVAVFNLLPWERSEVVRFSPNDPAIASVLPFSIVDGETGEALPMQFLSTGEVAFQAGGVPPLGYKLFHLVPSEYLGPLPVLESLGGATLENDAYRVEVDLATGGVRSLQDMSSAAELTRASGWLNQYVYNGGAASGFMVTGSDSGAVLQRLILAGTAPGSNRYESEIMLPAGQRRIDFRNRYDKRPPTNFEGVDFVFDFGLPDAALRYEIPFGHVRVFEDELSGFRSNHYAMQRWAVVSGSGASAILATDGPAIHAYPAGRFDGRVRLLTSFNTAGTAYRAGVGPLEAGFSLTTRDGAADAADATRFAYNFSVPLEVRVLPPRQEGALAEAGFSFLSVEGATLQLSTLKRPISGDGFIVRLYNPLPRAVEPTLSFGPEVLRVAETTLLESTRDFLPVVEQQAVVPFGPHEVKTLWLDLDVTTRREEPGRAAGIITLKPNFPNPFGRHTTIQYALGRRATVRLAVYDVLGREVSTIHASSRPAGQYAHVWSGADRQGRPLASGVYFLAVKVTAPDGMAELQSRTMIITR